MAYEVPPLPYDYAALEPTSTRRPCGSTTTSTIRRTSTRPMPLSRAPTGPTSRSRRSSRRSRSSRTTSAARSATTAAATSTTSCSGSRCRPTAAVAPDGDLAQAIDDAFGSFDDFKTKVKDAGVGQFGSGWAWLVHDGSGLAVVSTPNQDNPITDGKTPLLGVDVWEHAYYLKYQNKRPDYIDAWWNTIDWGKVAERYAAVS